MLIDQLCARWLETKVLETPAAREKTQTKTTWNKDIFRRTDQHFCVIIKKPEGSRTEGTKPRKGMSTNTRNYWRGHCLMCTKTTSTKCRQCSVYLCNIDEGNGSSCFENFHTNADIFEDEPNDDASEASSEDSDA